MAHYEVRAQRDGVPLSIHYLTMHLDETGRVSSQHYHEYTELLFGIEGCALVSMGTRRFELPAGAMVMIHSGEPHGVVSNGAPSTYHVLQFMPQILLTSEQSYSEYGYVLLLMEHFAEKQSFFDAKELEKTELPALFERVREEWQAQTFGHELSLRADVTRIFLYILRRWREQNLALMENIFHSGQRELCEKALSRIRAHYSDLTEEETAAACGVSPAYLSRTFKKSMKTSFSAYVTGVRLHEAERLLLTTDDNITDIALAVGFSTSAYFIARFREARGITPYRYRRLYRGDTSKM